MAVQEGDILDGRFELGRVAASGGMGLVFRATDRQTGALVAVKTLRAAEGADRFHREVQLLPRSITRRSWPISATASAGTSCIW